MNEVRETNKEREQWLNAIARDDQKDEWITHRSLPGKRVAMLGPVAISTQQPRILFRVRPASAPAYDVRQMPGCPRAASSTNSTHPAIPREDSSAKVSKRQPLEPDSA
jgi:hypothetical protein